MRIKKIEIENFRALRNSSIDFSPCTALLGENNCGKSAFLLAVDLFFASSPKITDKDFSDGNTKEPINITLRFSDFTPTDEEEFAGNKLDGELVVTRQFVFANSAESGRYFVSARVNPEFSACRAETGKTKKRELYDAIRKKYGEPPELPKEKNADEVDGYLEAWEEKHPEALKIERVASFKGWTNVAAGKLKQKTSYVLIKAVQDAAEDIQGSKSSPVKVLIDTLARQAIENSAKFKEFMEKTNKEIKEITDPKSVPMLAEISGGLSTILADYYKDSEVIATWEPIEQIQPAFPSAEIEVKDNDFVTGLNGVGHGLQRAIILTVLRYMADYRALEDGGDKKFKEPQSDLIIAIEEPEIYQHPTKQRLFGKLLRKLSDGFNALTGIRVQIIFVTHSPLLISIPNCEGIRMVRGKRNAEGKKNVFVREISLSSCSKRCAELWGKKPEEAWSASQFGAKLHTFDTELAEGFFSKCCVLVEGVGDQAVIQAWYAIRGRDPHAEGIVIADVVGKNNLEKPIVIFDELDIPCYWVFDNDRRESGKEGEKANKRDAHSKGVNRVLQSLGGIEKEKLSDWPDGGFARFTSWDMKLENYVASKMGDELFRSAREECSIEFDIDVDMTLKFPASAAKLLEIASKNGKAFPELDEILSAVDKLAA